MIRPFSVLTLTVLVSAAMYAGACGGEDPPASASSSSSSGTPDDLSDVIYEGGATDEALIALLSAQSELDPSQAAVLDAPTDGASLPGDPPSTFAWHIAGATGQRTTPAPRHRALWHALRDYLGPISLAHAHGTPINGRAYFLVISGPDGTPLLRVFTTNLTYTPDPAAWSSLRAPAGPLTATITNAIFEDNRIPDESGPFSAEPVTFSIEP